MQLREEEGRQCKQRVGHCECVEGCLPGQKGDPIAAPPPQVWSPGVGVEGFLPLTRSAGCFPLKSLVIARKANSCFSYSAEGWSSR